jgi:hypothetical protein
VIVARLVFAALLGGGARAAFTGGTLILCESSANGIGGRDVQFVLGGGVPFTVSGRRYSGPLTAAAGNLTPPRTAQRSHGNGGYHAAPMTRLAALAALLIAPSVAPAATVTPPSQTGPWRQLGATATSRAGC